MRTCIYASILSLSLVSLPAIAINETLFFRLNSSGQVEAVVAGQDAGGCAVTFMPPTSITIAGTSITIISPDLPVLPCIPPPPPHPPYEVVANLGSLLAPLYNVTWNRGIVLSAQLAPASLAPSAIPTLSAYSLLMMALLIIVLGMRKLHRV